LNGIQEVVGSIPSGSTTFLLDIIGISIGNRTCPTFPSVRGRVLKRLSLCKPLYRAMSSTIAEGLRRQKSVSEILFPLVVETSSTVRNSVVTNGSVVFELEGPNRGVGAVAIDDHAIEQWHLLGLPPRGDRVQPPDAQWLS
jgi:hypothetical protein